MIATGWSYPELQALPEGYTPFVIEAIRKARAAQQGRS